MGEKFNEPSGASAPPSGSVSGSGTAPEPAPPPTPDKGGSAPDTRRGSQPGGLASDDFVTNPPPEWMLYRDEDGRDWLRSPNGTRAVWDPEGGRWLDPESKLPMPKEFGGERRPPA